MKFFSKVKNFEQRETTTLFLTCPLIPPPLPPPPTFPHLTLNYLFLFIRGLAPGASGMLLLLGRLKRRRKRPAINLLPQAPIPKVAINSSDTFKTARILYIGYALYYTRTCNLVAIYPQPLFGNTEWRHPVGSRCTPSNHHLQIKGGNSEIQATHAMRHTWFLILSAFASLGVF